MKRHLKAFGIATGVFFVVLLIAVSPPIGLPVAAFIWSYYLSLDDNGDIWS